LYRYLTGCSGEIVHLLRTRGKSTAWGTCTVVVGAAGMMRVAEQPERSSIIFSSTRHLLNGDKKKIWSAEKKLLISRAYIHIYIIIFYFLYTFYFFFTMFPSTWKTTVSNNIGGRWYIYICVYCIRIYSNLPLPRMCYIHAAIQSCKRPINFVTPLRSVSFITTLSERSRRAVARRYILLIGSIYIYYIHSTHY